MSSPLLHVWYLAWSLTLIVLVCWRRPVLPWVAAASTYSLLMEAARPKIPSIAVAVWVGLAWLAAYAAWIALRRVEPTPLASVA